MNSKQLVETIRLIVQSEMKKTLKPILQSALKPLVQEMVKNKVNEVLAERYVASMSQQNQMTLVERSAPQQQQKVPAASSSRFEEMKKKLQVDNSPLGALLEGMDDHELRAMQSSAGASASGIPYDDDDEGVPLDMITGLMSR